AATQLRAQPGALRRSGAVVDLTVQCEYMPGADCIAVVTEPTWSCVGSEVVEVRSRGGGLVFVISRDRPGPRLMAAPGGVVALPIVRLTGGGIGVVSRREDRAGDRVEQL